MLQHINVGHKKLADYSSLAGRRLMDQIQRLAEPLKGKRVLHLSATAFGGGVAEINYTLLPLMVDAGLEAEWRVIWGQEEFFRVTKTIHNALQGSPEGLGEAERAIYDDYNRRNAETLEDSWDIVIVHDPQPMRHGGVRTRGGPPLDLALPHRPLAAESGRARLPDAVALHVRRDDLPPPRVRAG